MAGHENSSAGLTGLLPSLRVTLPFHNLAPLKTKRGVSYKYDHYVSEQARTQATQVLGENAQLTYLGLWWRVLRIFGGVGYDRPAYVGTG